MKRLISILLALLMVAVMLPVMAMAEGTTLPTAENGVITLTENVVLAEAVEITNDVTIDLHGFSITSNNTTSGKVIIAMANVTIKDSTGGGRIESTSVKKDSSAAIRVGTAGTDKDITVTIESGTMKGRDCGIFVAGINSKLVVNGGHIEGTNGFGVSGNGSVEEGTGTPKCGPTTITINGGKIIGGGTGIYHPQVGKLTINNGEITGKTGVEIRAGELIVNGGTITATGDPTSTDPNGNGTTTVGAAVAIAQHTTKKNIAVTINGGTFTGKAALLESNPQNNGTEYTKNISVNVSGGTFNGDVNKDDVDASKLLINGGTFTKKESGAEKYLANGKELDSNGKVVNTSITIIVPSDGGNTTTTPSTDKTKNPGTGANDFVGVAAAMAVVSLLGAAAVIRKK